MKVGDVLLLLVDDAAKLERKRRRDRDGAGDVFVIVCHLGVLVGRQDATDDIAGVVGAHAADHGVEVDRLASQIGPRKIGEIEPDRDRQAQQQQHDEQAAHQAA